ncbi:MAG: DUF2726 domain-containing protein [Phycisphaerae bacterium]|nr:DUF2726 domain-containing protein [Phycisphaerae bacterium]
MNILGNSFLILSLTFAIIAVIVILVAIHPKNRLRIVNTPRKSEQVIITSPEESNKCDFSGSDVWPYYRRSHVMSSPEQVLYFRLVEALPDCIIFSQVQLSRLLGVGKGSDFIFWFNKINRMSVDFVICDKSSQIISIIELDDKTHDLEDRKIADLKKNKAISDAGIKLIRWYVGSLPSVADIGMLFNSSKYI